MKTCFKCKSTKPISDFYKHKKMADGHLGKCKECTKNDAKATRLARIDYYRSYDVLRGRTQKRIANTVRVSAEWYAADNRRMRAHNMVHRAVRSGVLVPSPCERCGRETNIHAHHDDYDKPLSVMWLCPPCHRQRHKELEDTAA